MVTEEMTGFTLESRNSEHLGIEELVKRIRRGSCRLVNRRHLTPTTLLAYCDITTLLPK